MTGAPNSRRNLDAALRRLGGDDGDYVRRRTVVATAVVGGMMPAGAVKGGSAMKMRFGDAATRASTDLDVARRHGLDEFVEGLEDSLAAGWAGFAGVVVAREPAHPAGVPEAYVMQPYDVRLSYLGQPWCTVPLEVGHDEIGDADDPDLVVPAAANAVLGALGLPTLGPIPTMALCHQVAQKLHAASAPGGSRAHDLVDLQLIVAMGDVDWREARLTCERLFAYRRQQAWPPRIVGGDGWGTLYDRAREGLDVIPDVGRAIRWANDLVDRIASA